jgi:hypothetical protein
MHHLLRRTHRGLGLLLRSILQLNMWGDDIVAVCTVPAPSIVISSSGVDEQSASGELGACSKVTVDPDEAQLPKDDRRSISGRSARKRRSSLI